jgi:hypothetical protein
LYQFARRTLADACARRRHASSSCRMPYCSSFL